jgi:hypothetical protein
MLEPDKVRAEMKALQRHFKTKRDYVLDRLGGLGFRIKHVPDSTFYIWLDLSGLPKEINDGLSFFQKCLEERVIGALSSFLITSTTHPSIQSQNKTNPLSSSSTNSRPRHLLRPKPRQATRSVR